MNEFQLGDKVRVKHPTGGVLTSDVFTVVEEPSDARFQGLIWIDGEWGWPKRSGRRPMGFDPSSLEHVEDEPVAQCETCGEPIDHCQGHGEIAAEKLGLPHPATQERAKVEADLKARIEQNVEAKVMYRQGALTKEALMRTEEFVEQAIQNYRDACYAEMDDDHGLGKEGLDCARELLEDAVYYPLNRLSSGDRPEHAWLVADDKIKALSIAIGMKEEV